MSRSTKFRYMIGVPHNKECLKWVRNHFRFKTKVFSLIRREAATLVPTTERAAKNRSHIMWTAPSVCAGYEGWLYMVTTICSGQKSELSFFTRLNYLNLPGTATPPHTNLDTMYVDQSGLVKCSASYMHCATDIRNIVIFPPIQCHFVAISPAPSCSVCVKQQQDGGIRLGWLEIST